MSIERTPARESRLPLGRITVKQCGYEECKPGHFYGPAVRDYYLIHYVASGKGTFYSARGAFPLHEGQGFIIFPHEITRYQADIKQPWTYAWVGYHGRDAEAVTKQVGLTADHPVFTAEPERRMFEILQTMTEEIAYLRMGDLAALGGLYRFLSLIAQSGPETESNPHQQYYQKACWYMEGNYHLGIQVADIASFVGLSRSQLFRVFMEVCGASPKESLTDLRMKKALALLEGQKLKQEEIAASLGYSSGAQFTQAFNRYYGMPPRRWREENSERA
ncbi:MAG: AraC family transcriptional regulator [Eubacteriales bacterium]|nr:AraC family transcriptional regulator [Eubacteriales bacterium]